MADRDKVLGDTRHHYLRDEQDFVKRENPENPVIVCDTCGDVNDPRDLRTRNDAGELNCKKCGSPLE